MALATMMPVVFGDERDQVLKQFNQVQASWGTGKGIFSHNRPFVEFGSQYNRFKVHMPVTVYCMPCASMSVGQVSLTGLIPRRYKQTDVVLCSLLAYVSQVLVSSTVTT